MLKIHGDTQDPLPARSQGTCQSLHKTETAGKQENKKKGVEVHGDKKKKVLKFMEKKEKKTRW